MSDKKILDQLRARFPYFRRRWLEELVDTREVRLKDEQIYLTSDAEKILREYPAASNEPKPKILLENEHFLAVEKKPGEHCLPQKLTDRDTLSQTVNHHFPQIQEQIRTKFPDSVEPGLLHRLDRLTSGIVVFAKNTEAFRVARENWDSPQTVKEYQAVVYNPGKKKFAVPHDIQIPLFRKGAKGATITWEGSKNAEAFPAHSILVKQVRLQAGKNPGTASALNLASDDFLELWTLRLRSGFMHQLRAHCAALGCPILGDPLYGGPSRERLWLHHARFEMFMGTERGILEVESAFKLSTPFA